MHRRLYQLLSKLHIGIKYLRKSAREVLKSIIVRLLANIWIVWHFRSRVCFLHQVSKWERILLSWTRQIELVSISGSVTHHNHDHFLPYPFECIIHRSLYHSALYNRRYSVVKKHKRNISAYYTQVNLYIYKSESGWLGFFVCVLLGDGGLLLCSGGVFFGVRSGGNDIFDIYMTVAMQRGRFLWGPFWVHYLTTMP
jgi:hypothetical protein